MSLLLVTGLAALALQSSPEGQAQACTPAVRNAVPAMLREEIALGNSDLDAARASGDVERLIGHFAPDSVVMPEQQQRLFGTGQARGYYRALFPRLGITGYTSTTADIVPLDNGALEWGTFELTYRPGTAPAPQALAGKYMQLWRRQGDGTLKLKAEIWGFLAPLGEAASNGWSMRPPPHRRRAD